MAVLSRGQTYGVTETITNTKLHNLIDMGSVTGIVNADCSASMDLANSKLANIIDSNKVGGTSLFGLASTPSGAGVIPSANIPLLGSSLVSLVSIPNLSLIPISLSSWVSGGSFKNLASVPSLAGLLPYNNLVSSLASGGLAVYNGSSNFTGKNLSQLIQQDYTLVYTNTLTDFGSTITNDSYSSLTCSSKNYKIIIKFRQSGGGTTPPKLTLNSDTNTANYTGEGQFSASNGLLLQPTISINTVLYYSIFLSKQIESSQDVYGSMNGSSTDGGLVSVNGSFLYDASAEVTTITITAGTTQNNNDLEWYIYELAQS